MGKSKSSSSPKRRRFTPERRKAFIKALKASRNVREAARTVGFTTGCAYGWRDRDEEFRTQWADAVGSEIILEPRRINPGGRGAKTAMVARRHDAPTEEERAAFLDHLAITSNVAESAREAGLCKQTMYRLQRRDPAFDRQWREALTDGYTYLEMEMLARARFGTESPITYGGKQTDVVKKYSDAVGIRLLVVHRDLVAQQRALESDRDEGDILEQLDATLAEMSARKAIGNDPHDPE